MVAVTALARIPVRTLANVLLEIAHQNTLNKQNHVRWDAAFKAGDRAEEEWQADIGAAIEQIISELEDEARAMIEAATGVSWEALYEVLA